MEAHGVEFVIAPHGQSAAGPTLTHAEVDILTHAAKGTPLTPDMVHAIAAAKRVFPESRIESATAGHGEDS